MARVSAATAVVAVVVLAGCGGAVAPGPDGTPTRTVTPAPVPEATGTPRSPPELAPGLSAEGVFDSVRLADAHAAALTDGSFTAVREERRRYVNGSLRSSYRSVVRMSDGGDRFRYELNQTDVDDGRTSEQRLARYSDGSVVYVATTREGETTYSVVGGPDTPADPETVLPGNATARFGILRLFGSLRFEVLDSRTIDGRTVHRLTVENGSQTLGGLRNVSMTATVREDGLVTAYRLSYRVENLRVFVAVEFRRVGETEVVPPDWLPAARNATGVGTPTDRARTGTPTPSPGASATAAGAARNRGGVGGAVRTAGITGAAGAAKPTTATPTGAAKPTTATPTGAG